jgi:hypothetical protein
VRAAEDGVSRLTWRSETFAIADSWDEKKGGFLGLRGGQTTRVSADSTAVLVKPEAAVAQIERERQSEPVPTESGEDDPNRPESIVQPPPELRARVLRRFHGSVSLDPDRLGRDAGRIAEEIVQHLNALKNAGVSLTLEIEANLPEGAPDTVVRIVTENARTLKFKTQGFEED